MPRKTECKKSCIKNSAIEVAAITVHRQFFFFAMTLSPFFVHHSFLLFSGDAAGSIGSEMAGRGRVK